MRGQRRRGHGPTTSGRDSFRCENVIVELSVRPRSATTPMRYVWKVELMAGRVVKVEGELQFLPLPTCRKQSG